MLKRLYRENQIMIHVVLLAAIAGLIFFYPFEGSHFRITFGVAVLAAQMLYFPNLPVLITSILSGLLIFFVRSIIHLPVGIPDFWAAAAHNWPALAYYIAYGLWFKYLRIKAYMDSVPIVVLLLTITDLVSNCAELFVRGELFADHVEAHFVAIATVAILRSTLALIIYYALKLYLNFALAKERLARYSELAVLTAQLKAELFYLKKSSQDIERVMEASYELYQDLNGRANGCRERAEKALAVAREIHEVKKDYYRVAAGIEKVIEPSYVENGMKLSEICYIIEQNTRRYIQKIEEKIRFMIYYVNDCRTKHHYTIVSILNDLVVNAIEAGATRCEVTIQYLKDEQAIRLIVADNGGGIKEEDFGLIFQAGYSTKFCPHTGEMSTGLGLAHVKNLTDSMGGTIDLRSEVGRYTRFVVRLPVGKLE